MFTLDGKKINITKDLILGEGDSAITIPAESLRDPSTRAFYGIIEVPDLPKPDENLYYVYENPDGTYRAEPKNLADLQNIVWERIKGLRDTRQDMGFQYDGKWYHSDIKSKAQHLGNKDTARDQLAAGGVMEDPLLDPITNQQIVWKTMSGEWQPLTCAAAFGIVSAAKAAEFATFAMAQFHYVEMKKLTNPFEYDYFTGWPAVYSDQAV